MSKNKSEAKLDRCIDKVGLVLEWAKAKEYFGAYTVLDEVQTDLVDLIDEVLPHLKDATEEAAA